MVTQARFRIGLDFDDVLILSADHTAQLYNKLYGTHVTRDDWYDDPSIVEPWEVKTFEEVVNRVISIHGSQDSLEVEPLGGAHEVLKKLKDAGHELVVITGRPEVVRSNTVAILKKLYGDVIDVDELYFTNYFQHGGGKKISKGDIAKQLKLTHFIDDVIANVNSVAATGVRTILFGTNYKWNQGDPDKEVTRLSTWKEIGAYFDDEQPAK